MVHIFQIQIYNRNVNLDSKSLNKDIIIKNVIWFNKNKQVLQNIYNNFKDFWNFILVSRI